MVRVLASSPGQGQTKDYKIGIGLGLCFKVELPKKIVKFVKCIKSKCLSLINLKLIMSTIMINMIYTPSLPLIHCIFYIVLYTTLPYFDRGRRGLLRKNH
jgi:hypothetical protein